MSQSAWSCFVRVNDPPCWRSLEYLRARGHVLGGMIWEGLRCQRGSTAPLLSMGCGTAATSIASLQHLYHLGFGWLRYLLSGSVDKKTFPNINSKKTFQTFPKWCRSDWVLRCLEFEFRLANFETQNLNAWLSSCTAYVRPSFDVFFSCLSMARTVVRACVATRRDAVSRQSSFRRFQKQKCL